MSDMESVFKTLLETDEGSWKELDAGYSALDELLPILGPCSLPSVLEAIAEYAGYSDEERAIVNEAKARVIASDEIYQARSTPPQ